MKYFLLICVFVFNFSHAKAETLCSHLSLHHTPKDDVTYSPSIEGVPADLNPSLIEVGEIEIPLTNYLAEKLGLTVPLSSSKLGSVRINQAGQVIYKDTDISDKAESLCQSEERKAEKQDGQTDVESVQSIPPYNEPYNN